MAAGKAYQYHLGFEEETTLQLLHAHAQLLLDPISHHLICQQQPTTRSYLSKQQQQHTRPRQRRNAPNWATGVPGMQTVFLGPSPTSCGTGVFLPQRPPLHFHPNTKAPPPADQNRFRDVKGGGAERGSGVGNNKKGKDKGHSNFSRSKSKSPGVFLPKEWTY